MYCMYTVRLCLCVLTLLLRIWQEKGRERAYANEKGDNPVYYVYTVRLCLCVLTLLVRIWQEKGRERAYANEKGDNQVYYVYTVVALERIRSISPLFLPN